jgi:hypothetical protein
MFTFSLLKLDYLSYAGLIIPNYGSGKWSFLRSLRVLRALKTITLIPGSFSKFKFTFLMNIK